VKSVRLGSPGLSTSAPSTAIGMATRRRALMPSPLRRPRDTPRASA
jgi:hypothetical protein